MLTQQRGQNYSLRWICCWAWGSPGFLASLQPVKVCNDHYQPLLHRTLSLSIYSGESSRQASGLLPQIPGLCCSVFHLAGWSLARDRHPGWASTNTEIQKSYLLPCSQVDVKTACPFRSICQTMQRGLGKCTQKVLESHGYYGPLSDLMYKCVRDLTHMEGSWN